MNADIFKRPVSSPVETFYQLAYSTKTLPQMFAIVDDLDVDDDAEMLQVIFKKCKHRAIVLRVGKMLYYERN